MSDESLILVPFECELFEWSVKPGEKTRQGMDLCSVVVEGGHIMSIDSPMTAIVAEIFPARGDSLCPGDKVALLKPVPPTTKATTKGYVLKRLISGFLFETEEVDHDHARVSKFAHGRHDFQIRYEDGKVFRVTVEEWNEGKNCPALPRD